MNHLLFPCGIRYLRINRESYDIVFVSVCLVDQATDLVSVRLVTKLHPTFPGSSGFL